MAHFKNVRTILYVYENDGIEVYAGSDDLELQKYPKDDNAPFVITANRLIPLLKGVYRLTKEANDETQFYCSINMADVVSIDIKDDYPDPTLNKATSRFSKAFPNVTYAGLKEFCPKGGGTRSRKPKSIRRVVQSAAKRSRRKTS